MEKQYHHWFSPSLGKEMELNVYGHDGKPIIVFPSSGGSFHEYEDFGMVGCISEFIDSGRVRLFTLDSVDNESWLNTGISPSERADRHNAYDAYVIFEAIPFAANFCGRGDFLATGNSLGGYHAMNFFLRHPDVFNAVIALSGIYSLNWLVGGSMNENIYFNSPLNYLPGCYDSWFLDKYRSSQIVACCGRGAWENEAIHDTSILSNIFREKDIPAWVDFWGPDVKHDWDWWRVQLPYFLGYMV